MRISYVVLSFFLVSYSLAAPMPPRLPRLKIPKLTPKPASPAGSGHTPTPGDVVSVSPKDVTGLPQLTDASGNVKPGASIPHPAVVTGVDHAAGTADLIPVSHTQVHPTQSSDIAPHTPSVPNLSGKGFFGKATAKFKDILPGKGKLAGKKTSQPDLKALQQEQQKHSPTSPTAPQLPNPKNPGPGTSGTSGTSGST